MFNVSYIIDCIIHSGHMTSVDVFKAVGDDRAAASYIIKHHLDEELEEYLMNKAVEVYRAHHQE